MPIQSITGNGLPVGFKGDTSKPVYSGSVSVLGGGLRQFYTYNGQSGSFDIAKGEDVVQATKNHEASLVGGSEKVSGDPNVPAAGQEYDLKKLPVSVNPYNTNGGQNGAMTYDQIQQKLNEIKSRVSILAPQVATASGSKTTPQQQTLTPEQSQQMTQDKTDLQKLLSSVSGGNYTTGAGSISDQIAKLTSSIGGFGSTTTATPDLVANRNTLAGQTGGLNDVQNQFLTAQQNLRNFEAEVSNQANTAKSQTGVTSRYINGVLTKLSADTAAEHTRLQNEVSNAQDRVQMANTTLNSIMQLTQQSYENSRNSVNDNFSKNLQIFSALNTARSTDATINNINVDNANASILTISKAMENKKFDPASITPELQSQWHTLDMQGGHPLGFTEGIIRFTAGSGYKVDTWKTTNDGVTSIYAQDPSGKSVLIQTVGTNTGNGDAGDAGSKITNYLLSKAGTDHYVSEETYKTARDSWMKDFGNNPKISESFDTRFGNFVNPAKASEYGIKWKAGVPSAFDAWLGSSMTNSTQQ